MEYNAKKEQAEYSNQAEVRAGVEDPHLSTSDGMHIKMPNAGIEHYGTVNYDTPTRSDSNKG